MTQNTVVAEPKLVCLIFSAPTCETVTHQLDPNGSVIVGSGDRCGMRLTVESIADRHCMVRYVAGEIMVMDWFSEAGTFVNDRRISEETRVRPDDSLRLGNHELKIMMHDLVARAAEAPTEYQPIVSLCPEVSSDDMVRSFDGGRDDFQIESVEDARERGDRETNYRASNARLQIELAQAQEELAFLRQELEARLAPSPAAENGESHRDESYSTEIDGLRAEIIQLQTELAERDAAILASMDGLPADNCDVDETPTDTEALVERLEQMLDELQSADRRAATLDDLLRSSADEHRADVEEREHLENWVAEIEQRIGEREESWNAERSRLEAKIVDLTAQRQQADQALAESARTQAGAPAEKLVADLQRKYELAVQKLDAAQEEIAKLKSIVHKAQNNTEQTKRIQELEDLIRRREVEISQERASLARQRAELDRTRVDIERAPRALDRADENDIRIQAFRAHLRGIHEQEQMERKEQRSTSLAGRIAQLWQRLDGNDR